MDGDISAAAGPHQNSGALSRGGQRASGAGSADGGPIGPAGGGGAAARPRLDEAVPLNGYRWWYVDALSDDGRHGLTVIAFVGSVFSPYYLAARRRGPAQPENHCAINVALYGAKRRWSMTEHGTRHMRRDADSFAVGATSLHWQGGRLRIEINARCAPLPFPLKGRIDLYTDHFSATTMVLDGTGCHRWRPVAPEARVEVNLEQPRLGWSGAAYHDMNWGEEPLEQGFASWTWARAHTKAGTQVIYDAQRRDGSRQAFGLAFAQGQSRPISVPPEWALPRGLWRMPRPLHADAAPELVATLEDAPFYTRNRVRMDLNGEACEAIHESLSLPRFVHPITQWMLPFRMPRRG
jgi:carotenoid 1,2-hydratase